MPKMGRDEVIDVCELGVLACIEVAGQWRILDAHHERVVLERCQVRATVDERDGKCHSRITAAILNLECGNLLCMRLDE
jgi:hypothetical protein